MTNSIPNGSRPLSPNIQIYRPQLTSVLSIANRITGVVLSLYAVVLVVWLVAAADGPHAYGTVQRRHPIMGRPDLSVRLHLFVFPASLRRHSPSRLGCGTRLRARRDIRIGMDGGGGEHGAHGDHLDHQQRLGRIEPMNRKPMRSPLGQALGLGSAKNGVEHWWASAGHSHSAGAFDGMVRGLADGACGR